MMDLIFHRFEFGMQNQLVSKLRNLRSGNAFIFNAYPPRWAECDVLEVSRNGYSQEYELKHTLASFTADKRKHVRNLGSREKVSLKHPLIRKGKGPNKFWFVCPVGVISISILPKWAGLIYLSEDQLIVIRDAPLLRRDRNVFYRFNEAKLLSMNIPSWHRRYLGTFKGMWK